MKEFSKYLSIVSGLLIFLGFINQQTYYWWFDINIYSYVSTGEVLLSFLSIILQIIFVLLLLLLFHGLDKLSKRVFKWALKKIKVIKNRIISYSIVVVLSIIVYIITMFSIPFLLKLLQLQTREGFVFYLFLKEYIAISFAVSMIVIMILWMNREKAVRWIKTKFSLELSIRAYGVSLSLLFLLFCICLKNYSKADGVLSGKAIYQTEFQYFNQPIMTTKSITFIGETQDYVFLRDLEEKENHIYRRENITSFKIKKINSNSSFPVAIDNTTTIKEESNVATCASEIKDVNDTTITIDTSSTVDIE